MQLVIMMMALIGILLDRPAQVVAQFELPPPPCTNASLHQPNFIWSTTNQGAFSTDVAGGARMGALGGAGNRIGNNQMYVVNSVVFGFNGNMTHSNSALFSFGRGNNGGSASGASHEFRVRADNGAVFDQTPIRAPSFLIQDDLQERKNVTSLGQYLTGLSTTATQILLGLQAYRYQWSTNFSPEGRFRYGFVPSEVAEVDSTLGVVNRTFHEQIGTPAVVNKTDVCQFANDPPSQLSSITDLNGAVDLVSLVALMTQSILELNTRLDLLEQGTIT